jgi:hypothetical protein
VNVATHRCVYCEEDRVRVTLSFAETRKLCAELRADRYMSKVLKEMIERAIGK